MNRTDLLEQFKQKHNEIKTLQNVIRENTKKIDLLQQESAEIGKTLFQMRPRIEEANPGDLLEGNSIVIDKNQDQILIAAPAETEVASDWTSDFKPAFDKLSDHGLNPSDWFIPSINQLMLARNNAKNHFSDLYWSCEEVDDNLAKIFYFHTSKGSVFDSRKSFVAKIRLFTIVHSCTTN